MIRSPTTGTSYVFFAYGRNCDSVLSAFIGFHPTKMHLERGNCYADKLLSSNYLRAAVILFYDQRGGDLLCVCVVSLSLAQNEIHMRQYLPDSHEEDHQVDPCNDQHDNHVGETRHSPCAECHGVTSGVAATRKQHLVSNTARDNKMYHT